MALSIASQNILNKYNAYKTQNATQTKPKTTILGDAAIKAAQALSEKFGIPTFNLSGQVQTIPLTRPATGINVGTGSTGLSISAFNDIIKRLSPQKATVDVRPVIISNGAAIIDVPTSSALTKSEIPLSQIVDTNKPTSIGKSFSDTLSQYTPYIILGGIGLIALTLLRK